MRLAILPYLATAVCLLYLPPCHAQAGENASAIELNDGLVAYSTENFPLAFRILHSLAEKNVPLAQMFVGRMFAHGYGTLQNCERAVEWLTRASERGNADAAYDLASFSERGNCLPRSMPQALTWYQVAAANGDTQAPNKIGEIYLDRTDLPPDFEKAAHWFARGAMLFDADAYYHLGEMYASGRGFSRDLVEAYKWFDLADGLDVADQVSGLTKGAVARNRIRESLMPAQVDEGRKRANKFMAQLLASMGTLASSQTAIATTVNR